MIKNEASKVPENWQECVLSDILYFQNGHAFKSHDFIKNNADEELIPLVKQSQLKGSQVILDDCVFLPSEYLDKYSDFIIRKGDILIGMSGSIGKMSFYNYDYPSLLNQRVGKLELYSKDIFNNNFFGYLLLNLEQNIQTIAKGMGVQNVSSKDIEKIIINLPPINEQNRIVDKIETLFSEVDAGIANLTLAKRQLEQYRQSLLKHAFEGKLTAKWREKHGKALPSADELLEQIQTARQNHYDQQMADWEQAVEAWEEEDKEGKKPRKPNALKKLESIADLNEINLPKLPSSWLWERLGLMTLSVEYGTSTKSEKQGLVPVLRMGNMQNGIIDWDDLVFTSGTDEIEKYALKKGDVLFNRTNSPELVGKTSIILSDTKAIFAGYLIRVNQLDSIVYSKYLNYFLGSHIAKQYGNFVKTDGVNQSNINGQKLMNYPFPYCSLDEQVLIVAELDKKIGTADKFKEEIESTIKKLVNLKTSILHKAFQGKLVPQDPNDPPASELLAQIKAEREAKALAEKQAKQDKATSKSKEKIKSAKTSKKSKKDEQITLPL